MKMIIKSIIFELRNIINRIKVKENSSPSLIRVGNSRQSWERAFISLHQPVLSRFSQGKARVWIRGPQVSISGKQSDSYEGFARTFIGVAFYLYQKKENNYLGEIYKQGIINGTNPNHAEYWGKIKSKQRLVENAAVSLGLLLTKRHILSKLSLDERNNLKNWFQLNLNQDFYLNNWQWFKVFHYLLLEELNSSREGIEETLNGLEKFYKGQGWYTDDLLENRYDYYNAWGFHFYSLLFVLLADDKYDSWKKKYIERAKEFISHYQYFFTPGGLPVFYGRSQIYRFANLAPFGIALLLNCCNANQDWIKKISIDTINSFLERGALRKDGIFNMGFMLERYSGPASAYWAFKGFSFLLLPEDHAFWDIRPEEIKPKKLIHSIPIIKMTLIHDGKSGIRMFNAGSSCSTMPIKYNKFIYSNKQGKLKNE